MSLVTVASYRDPNAAHIARAFLETEGIPAFVSHEHHVGVEWTLSFALGGVKVQVPARYAEEAAELLRAGAASASETTAGPELDEGDTCPVCGSTAIEPSPVERRTKALSLLVNVPFGLRRGHWRCRACGHSWRPPRPHRSPLAIAAYLFALVLYLANGLVALLLLVPAQAKRLILFGSRRYHCWRCGAEYAQDQRECPACGIPLPSPIAYERHVAEGERYDAACEACHLPYRRSDYEPGRVARCSWCHEDL